MRYRAIMVAVAVLAVVGVGAWLLSLRGANASQSPVRSGSPAARAVEFATSAAQHSAGSAQPALESTDRLADSAVEEVASSVVAEIGAKADDLIASRVILTSIREIETHRLAVLHSLEPYEARAPALKAELTSELGPVTLDAIPTFVANACELEESFWRQGDFENPSSFDALFKARAALDMCLAAEPDDESALRAYCEVVMAGWPVCNSSDPLANAGVKDIYIPMNTLWEKHIENKIAPSVQDILVAADLLTYALAVPEEVKASVATRVKDQNPSASQDDIKAALRQWRKERQTRIAEWGLNACQAHGGKEWQAYADYFRESLDSINQYGYSTVTTWLIPYGPDVKPSQEEALTNRFILGRGQSFHGPAAFLALEPARK